MSDENAARERPVRILIVSYLFPPAGGSGVVRTTKLARHLPDHGVRPDFLTSSDAAPYRDSERVCEIPSETVVRRCPGLLRMQWRMSKEGGSAGKPAARPRNRSAVRSFLRGWLSIPDRAIYWAPFALHRGLRMHRQRAYEAIYGMGGPWTNLIVARALARRLDLPLVTDFKEPWGLGPPLGWPNPIRRLVERRLERESVRDSSLVICASPGIRSDLLQRMPFLQERTELVANGYEPEDYRSREEPDRSSRLRIVHTGYLSRAFSVEPVVRGLASAVSLGIDVEVRFVGEHEADIAALARSHGVSDRVETRGPVSYQEAIREQRSAGALLVLSSRSPLPGGAMPSKVYEYLGARRPILAIGPAGSALARFLESLGLPGPVDPGKPEDIARMLGTLSRGEGRVPSPEALEPYHWSDLVGRIARSIREVARRSSQMKSLDRSPTAAVQ